MPIIDKTKTFIKTHKTQIAVVGVLVVAAIAATVVIIAQQDAIAEHFEDDSIEIITHPDGSFTVQDAKPSN